MTKLSKEFKIIDGKVVKDEKAVNAGLNLCARLAKRANAKKPKVASRAKALSVKAIQS
jgi:hypothetical protein